MLFAKTFPDQTKTEAANATARQFAEEKIRLLVDDPAVADKLIPNDHPIGTKRIVTDTHYFETYNRPNVTLVDLKAAPIESISPSGITTADADYALDTLVFATGFDAMTGALDRMRIVGRGGVSLSEYWSEGPKTYLGLGVPGFPNLFVVTGPGSPSVLANMVLGAEQHVDWIADCIEHLWRRATTRSRRPSPPPSSGWSTAVSSQRRPCSRWRTPGTWAPTFRASPACSCRTSGGLRRVRADLRGRRGGGGVPRFRVQPIPGEAGRPGGIVSRTLVSRAGNCLRG